MTPESPPIGGSPDLPVEQTFPKSLNKTKQKVSNEWFMSKQDWGGMKEKLFFMDKCDTCDTSSCEGHSAQKAEIMEMLQHSK